MPADRPTIVVTAAVVRRENGYLVTRRLRGVHLENLWEFPGGKCEPGETHERCLRREIAEELGARAQVGPQILEVSHDYPDRTIELHFFECTLLGDPTPLLGQEIRWVAPGELGLLEFPPADAELIAMLQDTGREPGAGGQAGRSAVRDSKT
jgi:8-oxo-dGTP diphosphatase